MSSRTISDCTGILELDLSDRQPPYHITNRPIIRRAQTAMGTTIAVIVVALNEAEDAVEVAITPGPERLGDDD